MDYKMIQKYLEKYWEGETTLEEEATLKAYFNSDSVHPAFEKEAELFRFYQSESKLEMNEIAFEEKVIKQIETPNNVRAMRHRLTRWSVGIAASLLLLLAVYPSLQKDFELDKPSIAMEDTYKTPEEAYAATKKALMLVSRKLNKGTSKAAAGLTKVNDATDIFHLE